jgi:serine/threonine-protein kinase
MAAVPTDVSPDGTVALYSVNPQDIHTFRLEDKSPSEFLATPALEHMPMFSPDGKWLAYTSNESGKNQVWVRRYPRTPGVARLVSPDGGAGPVWSPDGSTLYYRGASGELMAVPTTLDPTFNAGRPRPLFRYAGIFRMSGTAAAYDIHPDGKRFIMVSEPDEPIAQGPDQIHIVLNWFDELKRLAPGR